MNMLHYAQLVSVWWVMISRMGPAHARVPPASDFKQGIREKVELVLVQVFPGAREWTAIS